MAKIYRIDQGDVVPMEAVLCKSEQVELQDLLERSPEELLAGEQIDPEKPRQWLQIKREMGVPDPVTGASRWSVDFLYVDQDGILTFVECKRHDDTRSRREVIGQVFDYAANAPRLWNVEQLRQAAQETHGGKLEAAAARIGIAPEKIGEFFDLAIANLQARKLRIILFLETAPPELKTLVEFLNADLMNVEVVLIEARLYRSGGIDVVAPTVWGYTEQVRTQRRFIADAISGGRRTWDEVSFFAALGERVSEDVGRQAVEKLYHQLPELGYRRTWGTGQTPSFNIRSPAAADLSLLTVYADGDIVVNYGYLGKSPAAETLRDQLSKRLLVLFPGARPPNYPNCWPRFKNAAWAPHVSEILRMLSEVSAREKEL